MRKLLGGPAIMLTGVLLILCGWAYGETTMRDLSDTQRVVWVQVRYSLPDANSGREYLIWGPGLPVTTASVIFVGDPLDKKYEWLTSRGDHVPLKYVTHWMRLPRPPKGV